MSLNFKYIPLTFLKDVNQIKVQIKNTVILRYLFDRYNSFSKLEKLIIGTQYGYNASALQSGQNKFLRISDITNGKVNWKSVPFCDCKDEETYLLNKNDLLIARTGGTTGKSFIIDSPPEKAIYAGYLIRIRANSENSPDFLNIFLNSYVYWSQVVSLNKGEFRPSVNATKIKSLIVPKIDIKIQKEAVKISKGISVKGYEELENSITETLKIFDESQEILKNIKTQKENIVLVKQAILQEAIQGKLTENWRKQNPNSESASELLERIKTEKAQLIKDKKIKKEKALPPITAEEIPFKLPEGWVWTLLDEVALFKNGKAHEQFVDANGKYILINSKFVSTNSKVKKHTSELMMPMFKDEIAIVMSDVPDGRALSRCFLIDQNEKYSLNQRIGGIVGLNGIYPQYLISVLDRNPYYLSFNDSKKQTNLKKDQILSCPIPLPPFDEQKAIVVKLECLKKKCTELEAEIKNSEANAQTLMQAVLKEAFEGKKEVVEL
jgi:type I restriction enzyme S subunit